jgi:hypothetical protein
MKKPRPKKRKSQHDKFVEAARAVGASEDECEFEEKLRWIAKPKPENKK